MTTYDVIVVGGGGSGLAAAVSAAESGLRVLLLEKRPQLGGTTGIAVGSFTAAATRQQRAQNVADNPRDHDVDAGKFAPPEIESRNRAVLRQFFLSHAAETLAWLEGLGLAFHGPSPEPPNRVARMHNVVPNAKAYIAVLHARLLHLGGEVWCGAAAEGILKAPGQPDVSDAGDRHMAVAEGALKAPGRAAGVIVRRGEQTQEVLATRGVVLATGDYAGNATIIARYKGPRFETIEGINPHATGDGHRMAEALGAELVNMDVTYGPELRFVAPAREPFAQLLPASGPLARLTGALLPWVPRRIVARVVKRLLVTWQHPENALLEDGAILVNRLGERFCDETVWPEREIAVSRQADKVAFMLLDERLVERYSRWPHFISTAPEIAYAYVDDYLRLRPDVAAAGASLDEIAAACGLDAAALGETIEAYNRAARGEGADPFGRQPPHALQGNRWLLLGPLKAYFTTTEGGAAIDQRLRVLDRSGMPVPGLYAVGQIGLGGQILWGHGLHIAWAMTSGRLVGKVLAEASNGGS